LVFLEKDHSNLCASVDIIEVMVAYS